MSQGHAAGSAAAAPHHALDTRATAEKDVLDDRCCETCGQLAIRRQPFGFVVCGGDQLTEGGGRVRAKQRHDGVSSHPTLCTRRASPRPPSFDQPAQSLRVAACLSAESACLLPAPCPHRLLNG